MDLGIRGKWALVCGASKGLGYGCALSLAREGVNLVLNARDAADRIIFMDAGQIVESGPASSILSGAQHERTRSFLAAVRH